jgi:hypothetical protein
MVNFGQEPKTIVSRVPDERRADTYAVYSAVMAHPSLSHPDVNLKYLIVDLSDFAGEHELQESCFLIPESYRANFSELLADRSQHSRERFRLERALAAPKPYDLITVDQANEFKHLRNSPGHTTDEVELFRGAVDVITLGNVYFDRKRTLAAVYTWASCGGLCGYGAWRVFIRDSKTEWGEQHWTTCLTVAAAWESRLKNADVEHRYLAHSNARLQNGVSR